MRRESVIFQTSDISVSFLKEKHSDVSQSTSGEALREVWSREHVPLGCEYNPPL